MISDLSKAEAVVADYFLERITRPALLATNLVDFPTAIDFRLFSDAVSEPTFNIAHVTLKGSSHIDLRISEYRLELANKRGSLKTANCPYGNDHVSGKLRLAFDHIVDSIREDMGPFALEAMPKWDILSLARRQEQDLRSISLLHRSLTSSAQHALRRRVVIYGRESLRRFLCSPLCGPWIREVVLHWNLDSRNFAREDDRNEVIAEMLRLLAALFSRAANVHSLCLRTGYGEPWEYDDIIPFLNSLSSLQSLEHLWLVHSDQDVQASRIIRNSRSGPQFCPHLRRLYYVLSRLRRLRTLSIRNWGSDGRDYSSVADNAPALSHPTLYSLEYEPSWAPGFTLPPPWLFEAPLPDASRGVFLVPRGNIKVNQQQMHILFSVLMIYLRKIVSTGVKSLHFCALHGLPNAVGPCLLDFTNDATVSTVQQLRRLHIIMRPEVLFIDFPPTLSELHLHFHFDFAPDRNVLDTMAHALIAKGSLKWLHMLRITVSSNHGPVKLFRDGSSISSVRLKLVRDFCEKKRFQLLCYAEELPVWARR